MTCPLPQGFALLPLTEEFASDLSAARPPAQAGTGEFDTVGLGRLRSTERWARQAK